MATAPGTLMWLARQWEAAIPGATFSGIVGDAAHGFGYHRSYNEVAGRGDYSCKLPGDRNGIDPNAACAIDVSHTPAMQREITRRFYNSWQSKTDLRLNHTREVIGSLDSRNVIYMDTQSGQRGSADSSHLWHVHVGGLRSAMITQHAVNAILSIVRGESWEQYAAAHPDDPFVNGKAPAPAPSPAPASGGPAFPLNPSPPHVFGLYDDPHSYVHGGYNGWEKPPVKQIQQQLIRKGVVGGVSDPNSSWADGVYGRATLNAVWEFQKRRGLGVDGLVGPQTWRALFS